MTHKRGSSSLSDALKRAFSEAGESLPGKKDPAASKRTSKRKGVPKVQWLANDENDRRKGGSTRASQKPTTMAGGSPDSARNNSASVSREKELEAEPAVPVGEEPDARRVRLTGDVNEIRAGAIFREKRSSSIGIQLRHDPHCWPEVPLTDRLANPRLLQIGLDMGTSTTKVVVADPARDRAWAIPFTDSTDNAYLLPTALVWENNRPRITARPGKVRPFKWLLLAGKDTKATRRDAAVYLAVVLRHVVAWMNSKYGDYYRPESTIWELRIGFPAESLDDTDLVQRYLAVVHTAIVLAGSRSPIGRNLAESELQRVLNELESTGPLKSDRSLESCGIVAPSEPSPEIAANIAGFYRSRQWDPEKPYGLLMDVGASTLDCSFASLVDTGDSANLNNFTLAVRPLGCHALHERRVEWLVEECAEFCGFDEGKISELMDDLLSLGHDQPVPESIDEYVDGLKFSDDGIDSEFLKELGETIVGECLVQGLRRFFRPGCAPKVIPVYTSGGGSRHALYQHVLKIASRNVSVSWSLEIVRPGLPASIATPLMTKDERDRLCIAWGLCNELNWLNRQPHEIQDLVKRTCDYSKAFVSKDQV